MTLAQAKLVSALKRGRSERRLQAFEKSFHTADPTPMNPGSIAVAPAPGNPAFTDQFSIQVITKYFTVAAGVWTNIAASALAASLKTYVAAFIFGYTDAQGGYSKAKQLLPLTGTGSSTTWGYNTQFVYGVNTPQASVNGTYTVLDSTALAFLQLGDLVLPFSASTAGPVYSVALVIVRLTNGIYSALLNALSSDVFQTNLVRYSMDSTLVAQFNNPIVLINYSWFGATKNDNIDPTAYKQPQQYQAGIVDIGINQSIYKAIGWGTYVNYDCVLFSLSVFVRRTDKIK